MDVSESLVVKDGRDVERLPGSCSDIGTSEKKGTWIGTGGSASRWPSASLSLGLCDLLLQGCHLGLVDEPALRLERTADCVRERALTSRLISWFHEDLVIHFSVCFAGVSVKTNE